MVDQHRAGELAREGFELWQADRLDEAAERYREALALAVPGSEEVADYHGELAGVLATLGRRAEAREQVPSSRWLAELRQDPDGPGVNINRYCLAELLLTMGDPDAALTALLPGLNSVNGQEWLLRLVQAEALWRLGQRHNAQHTASLAVELAPSDAAREQLRERLAPILEPR